MAEAPRILLVDDDPIMRELACEQLRAADYVVETAENGVAGLEILKREGADLVISDLDMPVMDGFSLTENIRADRTIAETPVIVITASDHADAVDRAFAAGATSFLAKPINWTLFNQAVKFVLRASEDQKALRAARDQAEAGAKFKDGLMSVMSHELRTPLNAIIGFGQLLVQRFEGQEDEAHKEYSRYVVDGGKRLLNTISDMLLASDARSGAISINETDLTVGDVIDRMLVTAQPAIETAGVDVRVTVQDRELEICCDRELLARAMAKLVENSVKFAQGPVNIQVGAALTKKGDLAILVKDDGPGISPEVLKNVTTPFSQMDMSLQRSKEGLGLGLPLVQAITSAHGAQFRLDSQLGAGAKAMILLPASRVVSRGGRGERAAA